MSRVRLLSSAEHSVDFFGDGLGDGAGVCSRTGDGDGDGAGVCSRTGDGDGDGDARGVGECSGDGEGDGVGDRTTTATPGDGVGVGKGNGDGKVLRSVVGGKSGSPGTTTFDLPGGATSGVGSEAALVGFSGLS
jgi:hypothetical protein